MPGYRIARLREDVAFIQEVVEALGRSRRASNERIGHGDHLRGCTYVGTRGVISGGRPGESSGCHAYLPLPRTAYLLQRFPHTIVIGNMRSHKDNRSESRIFIRRTPMPGLWSHPRYYPISKRHRPGWILRYAHPHPRRAPRGCTAIARR